MYKKLYITREKKNTKNRLHKIYMVCIYLLVLYMLLLEKDNSFVKSIFLCFKSVLKGYSLRQSIFSNFYLLLTYLNGGGMHFMFVCELVLCRELKG